MSLTGCPSPEELERLLDERLAPADLSRVSAHVAACPTCQKALESLTADGGPDLPSGHSWKSDDSLPPHPDFLDRMKQAPPPVRPPRRPRGSADEGQAPEPPSDGVVMLAEDDGADVFPALDDYEILGVLGRGAEGVVYKARHRPLGRLVALKMLRDAERAQPQSLVRFRLEAETLARLQHPNIVQVYEVGSRQNRPFFAMEYVHGGPLSARLTGQPLPPRDSAALVEALARAVHAAHQTGVVHRDLKPANVLLACGPAGKPFGVPKVSDFGLAKRVQVETSLTRTGMVLGTPGYMAPEQARAEGKDVGPASDVYALGSILYHLLTGRPPFVGPRPMDVLLQVVHDEPVSLRRLFPQTPRDLETICLKCLHKEPRRRYASAEALADDLRRSLDGRPIAARPAAPWERAWKAARRRPAVATLLAVSTLALLVLLAGGLYYNSRLAAALKASDDNLQDARAARKDADGATAQARAAEKTATAEAEEAKRQRGLAVKAYRKLVGVAQNTLPDAPGMRAPREVLMKTAAQGFKEIGDVSDSDEPDRAGAAILYEKGVLFQEAGDWDEAARCFEQCRQKAVELAGRGPADPELQGLLGRTLSALGLHSRQDGRIPEAEGYFRQEADAAAAWLAAEPNSPNARRLLADAYNQLADAAVEAADAEGAAKWDALLNGAIDAWLKAAPNHPGARYFLAALYDRHGRMYAANADVAGAVGAFLQAKAVLDDLRTTDSQNQQTYILTELDLMRDLTAAFVMAGDLDRAQKTATASAESYRKLHGSKYNEAADAETQLKTAEAYAQYGDVLLRMLRPDEAAKQFADALAVLNAVEGQPAPEKLKRQIAGRAQELRDETDLCRAMPQALDDPSFADGQPPARRLALLVARVGLLANKGRPADAAKAADQLDGLRAKDAAEWYSLARLCAAGAAGVAAGKDGAHCTPEERALRGRLADRAVAALGSAVESGWQDADAIRREPELTVLHGDPAFRAVLDRLEKPK